jgi:hypothetical protein
LSCNASVVKIYSATATARLYNIKKFSDALAYYNAGVVEGWSVFSVWNKIFLFSKRAM